MLAGVDIVLLAGHQLAVSAQVAGWAKAKGLPGVVAAGSCKPNVASVLAFAAVVVASPNF